MAAVKTGADAIRAALKSGTTAAAVKKFGKRPVYQVLRRDQAAKDKAVKAKAGAMPSIKKEKMSRDAKAKAAYERSKKKAEKLKEVKSKKPVKVKKVKDSATQKKLDDEMRRELKGETVKARRDRIKKASNPKKRRKAAQLTEGRETSADFEARMSREARQGGGTDVGKKKANRGSGSDPLYEYEAGQASSFLRGKDKPFMDEYEKELTELINRNKGGSVRGVGCAKRGYGKAMTKGKK